MSKLIVKDLEGPASSSNKIYIASGSQLDIAGSPDGASAINLAVDGSNITTGTITAARLPATGVSAASLTTGTLANARLADGHIVQVVSALSTNTATVSTDSTAWEDTGASAAITPSDASNKILVMIQFVWTASGTSDSARLMQLNFNCKRSISGGATTENIFGSGSGLSNQWLHPQTDTRSVGTLFGGIQCPAALIALDSPNASTAVTYELQFWNRSVDGSDNAGNAYQTQFTLMEVKA